MDLQDGPYTQVFPLTKKHTLSKYFWVMNHAVKGCRMGRSDKVSLWYVALLINTRFRFFILE